jgi:hypothetical protein
VGQVLEQSKDLTSGLKKHVTLTVDLKKIPSRRWSSKMGNFGEYYCCSFDLGVTFGAGGIGFQFLHDGKILGSVDCSYF